MQYTLLYRKVLVSKPDIYRQKKVERDRERQRKRERHTEKEIEGDRGKQRQTHGQTKNRHTDRQKTDTQTA